ncbi:MAG: pyruvate phosphate dikinase [Planctomycetes bacterium SM23_32]|nr:MAG: pyruvate phosphate dikinase [Planctomycetes bacterium SM23_32]
MSAEGTKRIYFFKQGKADGRTELKELLGGKGANLAEMSNVGLPVPPGFTITTQTCADFYKAGKQWPEGLEAELDQNIAKLEETTGRKLGDRHDPLLVSVRSGAAASMPGMMDTILNLGLNDESVQGLATESGNERFAWDCYRRFIEMFGNVAMFVPHRLFDQVLHKEREEAGVQYDSQLAAEQLAQVVEEFKAIYRDNTGEDFPTDPKEQLRRAIDAVFGSWNNPQAIRYREIHEIKGLLGTAVNVQTMVFGNMGHTSFTGVGFTRNPATGEDKLYGEYLVNAQGEDVVAGIRTPKDVSQMPQEDLSDFPEREIPPDEAKELYGRMYDQLVEVKHTLEKHYTDMQDFEFTAQQGHLYMLQTRTGKRTAMAAVQTAVDMKNEGLIDEQTAVMRVEPNQIEHLLHKQFDPADKDQAEQEGRHLATGLPASPGAAVGRIALTADDAERMAAEEQQKDEPIGIILVREETSPEDIGGMDAAVGILTARGGMTSHAAVVARGMGKCCVAGCGAVRPDEADRKVTIADTEFAEGDVLSLDGATGQVFAGAIKQVQPEMSGAFGTLMDWAEDYRKMGVWANADTPADAQVALNFGAEGIGLCRTEHMFFEEGRISFVRQMMLSAPDVRRLHKQLTDVEVAATQAAGEEKRAIQERIEAVKKELADRRRAFDQALQMLLPEQRKDFEGIFRVMDGLPVVVRLLDPPLHEFLPQVPEVQARLAEQMGIPAAEVADRVSELRELNPMLGHRGCRLGLTYPDVYNMQVRAIMEAAVNVKKEGVDVHPEIMIPLVGTDEELRVSREAAQEVCQDVLETAGVEVDYKIGTMIEVPRAALTADEVAQYADFFSFGTNDLTQMTYGFSRDDVGVFVPEYVDREILENDPFQVLDRAGVGQLVAMGVQKGRSTKPEPRSVKFCYEVGMNYVSCSPFRVPVARLAAAQAAIEQEA